MFSICEKLCCPLKFRHSSITNEKRFTSLLPNAKEKKRIKLEAKRNCFTVRSGLLQVSNDRIQVMKKKMKGKIESEYRKCKTYNTLIFIYRSENHNS